MILTLRRLLIQSSGATSGCSAPSVWHCIILIALEKINDDLNTHLSISAVDKYLCQHSTYATRRIQQFGMYTLDYFQAFKYVPSRTILLRTTTINVEGIQSVFKKKCETTSEELEDKFSELSI